LTQRARAKSTVKPAYKACRFAWTSHSVASSHRPVCSEGIRKKKRMDAKMHDEKLERGSADARFVEDDAAAKSVVRKMDVRFVSPAVEATRMGAGLTMEIASCRFSRSCFCARSLTARMSATRRSWACRRISTSMTISMRLGCVCFTQRISRGTSNRSPMGGVTGD
jgi:hypothetical protein